MRRFLNTAEAEDKWDMGLAELIEETPAQTPVQPKQFREETQADGTHVYMMRRTPSWARNGSGKNQYLV